MFLRAGGVRGHVTLNWFGLIVRVGVYCRCPVLRTGGVRGVFWSIPFRCSSVGFQIPVLICHRDVFRLGHLILNAFVGFRGRVTDWSGSIWLKAFACRLLLGGD